MLDNFIYSKEAKKILICVHKALFLCVKYGKNSKKLIPENQALIDCFSELGTSFDLHITEGLFDSHQKRGEKVYPRILKLALNAFKDAAEIKVKSEERGAVVIPSPLHILYHTLIVPEHPQTAGYSLAACRTLLFNLIETNFIDNHPFNKEFDVLTEIGQEGISQSMDSLSKNAKIQARWPTKSIHVTSKMPTRTYTNMLLGQFLSMKGVTHLWFKDKKEALSFLQLNELQDFYKQLSSNLTKPKFRLSNKYEELPDTGEIINQLYGIPIPIKGADVLFFGGLKPSSAGGMVIGLSGQAGIGKTSFALALANSLSPLGIKCFYLSLEEEVKDIQNRLFSLQTPFEKELSIYRKPKEWFYSTKAKETLQLTDLLKLIEKIGNEPENNILPNCDLSIKSIIIIDNLNEFFSDQDYGLIEKTIEKFRELKSIVVLIGGEGVLEKLRMEYLIDTGIKLVHEGIEKRGDKPLRLLNLYKTRHQLSRQGTHIFHMSGDEGFRISPQIPSQMDRKEKLKKLLYDGSKVIHALNYLNDDNGFFPILSELGSKSFLNNSDTFLKLYPRTHILIHGYGSAGKAGFALKLLLTPPVDQNKSTSLIKGLKFNSSISRRKILIISFLYPKKYYHDLIFEKKIDNEKNKGKEFYRIISENYKGLQEPIIDYLIFYPGYISPEDFINKIIRKLDKAILEGQPFNGVLVDGLHNVFLQFIRLQESDMVWPLLFNILSRYNLTVVSTFTNFAMNDRLLDDDPSSRNNIINQALPDHMLLQKGMAPFLHALVKASDFYFFLEQMVLNTGERKYLLSVKSAINQNVPTELLEWDRQRNVFIAIHSYKEILELMNGSEVS